MEDEVTLTAADEGKKVVNADGDLIGLVVSVDQGTAYIDPDPELTDTIRSQRGRGEADRKNYRLETASIERVSDNEIHLHR
jgi:cell shape-determining protein MreC